MRFRDAVGFRNMGVSVTTVDTDHYPLISRLKTRFYNLGNTMVAFVFHFYALDSNLGAFYL